MAFINGADILMEIRKINLAPPYERYGLSGEGLFPVLTCMIHNSQPERSFPAVVILPGGSYSRCSAREGEPVAARFYSYGYNCFILEYSCVDKIFPTALAELGAAVKFIRKNKTELRCEGKLTVCGFSAGGHLAASLGAYYGEFGDMGKIRPDGLILCYPVITSGEFTHGESVRNIAPSEELRERVSVEKHMTADFPPSFIWHCADDNIVPVENSLMLAGELSRRNIPFELHIFPNGGHGIALCDVTTVKDGNPRYINPTAAQWFGLALDWNGRLDGNFFDEK